MVRATRSLLLPFALVVIVAFFAVNQFCTSSTFVAPKPAASRSSKTALNAEDPLDFVAVTAKRIEANGENVQLGDNDGWQAILYTVLGLAFTALFLNLLYSLKPTA
eukprot:TRINITY_DN100298_c0_g1_i1.p2 TRINITY_DN100298_c0_g1~~TRINITY_DN100298_c0_g1_i1.p2  ORF type:complete len:106 (+),score=23.91 TRINITY_DN100298_c0_g1_i1:91-408(+)